MARIASAGTPVQRSASSGVYRATTSRTASKSSVRSRMYSSACSPSSRMTCIIAFSSQTSEPGRSCRCRFAIFVSQIARGSATTSVAPLRTAFLIRSASTGCASVVLEPITSRKRAFSISGIELVEAPLPNDLTRP